MITILLETVQYFLIILINILFISFIDKIKMDLELVLVVLSLFSMKFFGLADTGHVRKNTQNIDLLHQKISILENNFNNIQTSIDYCNKEYVSYDTGLYCKTLSIFLNNNEPYIKSQNFISLLDNSKYHTEIEIEEDHEYSEIDDDGSRYEYRY